MLVKQINILVDKLLAVLLTFFVGPVFMKYGIYVNICKNLNRQFIERVK